MLYNAKTLESYALESLEGDFREIVQFYFDDRCWMIRSLEAYVGENPLPDRKVLISTDSLLAVAQKEGRIHSSLTRTQIDNCPVMSSDISASRQFEAALHDYFVSPSTAQAGSESLPRIPYTNLDAGLAKQRVCDLREDVGSTHLRSTHEVACHHIEAMDGELGHVADFLIDDQTWTVRYLVADTLNWWPGRKVLIATEWIESISEEESKVFVGLTREAIREAPEYDEHAVITRDYETTLHRHHNRIGYWLGKTCDTDDRMQSLQQAANALRPLHSLEV